MRQEIERVKTSLQIEEDISLHETGWIVQRVGWGFMFIFLVLASLGLFGNGFLSETKVARDGTSLAFERFSRLESDTEIEIDTENNREFLEVVIPAGFMEAYKVERIVPEPAEQQLHNGSTIYLFKAHGRGHVTLFMSARRAGTLHCVLSVGKTEFRLNNFIFP